MLRSAWTESSTQNLKSTLLFKKSFRDAGRESFNLAITISANQPIKVSMRKVIAAQYLMKLACKNIPPEPGRRDGHDS